MDTLELVVIVLTLIVIVQQFLISRSYQPSQIDKLLGLLAGPVAKTPTKIDDYLLETAQLWHEHIRDVGARDVIVNKSTIPGARID